jgi:hypothetical protein
MRHLITTQEFELKKKNIIPKTPKKILDNNLK